MKKLFLTFFFIACAALMTINVSTASKDKKSYLTLSLSELSAGADGTCCREQGSICVIGQVVHMDCYAKQSGSCA
jgi:hypothetical protein